MSGTGCTVIAAGSGGAGTSVDSGADPVTFGGSRTGGNGGPIGCGAGPTGSLRRGVTVVSMSCAGTAGCVAPSDAGAAGAVTPGGVTCVSTGGVPGRISGAGAWAAT